MPSSEDYTSYSYLAPGELPAFDLSPEFGRVPAYDGGLAEDDATRAQRLLTESLVISLHDHPVRFPADMRDTPAYNRTGRQHTGFAGLAASGMTVVFDNMMDGTACVTTEPSSSWPTCWCVAGCTSCRQWSISCIAIRRQQWPIITRLIAIRR